MPQYKTEFMKLMETLDNINEEYKPLTLSAEEELSGKKAYYYHIKEGYVDMDAFHKAFDNQIAAEGLTDLFNADGTLIRRSYGVVKTPKSAVETEIKKLWVRVFSSSALPVGRAAFLDKRLQDAHEKELLRKAEERKYELAAKAEEEKRIEAAKAERERLAREESERLSKDERAGILLSVGLDTDFLRKEGHGFNTKYYFVTDSCVIELPDIKLESLESLPTEAKFAAYKLSSGYSGRCYYDDWDYYSWNSSLLDGEAYFKLVDGVSGSFGSHTTVFHGSEKDLPAAQRNFKSGAFLTGYGMDTWAEDEDECDSGD